jgi:hypothetical protein
LNANFFFISLNFFRAFDKLMYPLSGDLSKENKTIIIWDIECRFGLGMLSGVCSAWIIICISCGIDWYFKYSAGMLVGAIILSFIFKTIIIWDLECRFGLGTLIGVCSAWVLLDILLGMDGHIKYSAGTLVGVMMLSIIFNFVFGRQARDHRSGGEVMLTQCSEMNADTLLIV